MGKTTARQEGPRYRGDFRMSHPQVNPQIDFLQDRPQEMTWGRRIGLYLSEHSKWYNPRLGEPAGGPSLARAWAYFEHVTLERYVLNKSKSSRHLNKPEQHWFVRYFFKGERKLNIAEPGEREHRTKLYSPITTPLTQMGDFGLGYGIYFSTLRSYSILCLVAGLLNLPNMIYFATTYNGDSDQNGEASFMLRGSAICTDVTWVPCPGCPQEYEYQHYTFSKWSHVTGLHVERMPEDEGEWVNVSKYVSMLDDDTGEPLDHALRYEILYSYDGLDANGGLPGSKHFTAETIRAFERDFGVVVNTYNITLHNGRTLPCNDKYTLLPGENKCIAEYCWCQIESFQDCYCRFGVGAEDPSYEVKTLGFAERTNCEGATLRNGYINMASVFLFIAGALLIRRLQNDLIVKFDEDEQTAQDYSICVTNPPPSAHNPKEWKEFFESNFDCRVTVCTVDVENDHIVQVMAERRELLYKLGMQLQKTHEELTPKFLKSLKNKGKKDGVTKPVVKLLKRIEEVEEDIRGVLREDRDHPASAVFVTFETETGQRNVLNALHVGSFAAQRNDKSRLKDKKHLFRGRVLDVVEPEEPSAIRWQEIGTPPMRMYGILLFTSFCCMTVIAVAFTVILICYMSFPALGPIMTTVFTSIFPEIAKRLMGLELHGSESSRQKWLFIKIATFNILIAAVLLSVVNPFTATVDPNIDSLLGLIPSVHALFFSQLLLTPALQLLDIGGNLSRHFFAPRAKSQGEMNQCFDGTVMYLAERYGNLMKFLYLIVWYCAVYPAGFIMGFVALFITYFADRFSLMRTWARTPQVGTQISDFARNYYVPTALALMAVLSSYAWSGFPYDNLCTEDRENLAELDPAYFNVTWTLRARGTTTKVLGFDLFKAPDVNETVVFGEDAGVYKYCPQDLRGYVDDQSFPPLPKFQLDEWMTDEQADLLNVYGWVAAAIFGLVFAWFIIRNALDYKDLILGGHDHVGEDQGTPFSQVHSIDTYLPSCKTAVPYPLLLFDASGIDSNLFSWTDPEHPHAFYDITKDINGLIDPNEIKCRHLFAKVKHWPADATKKAGK